MDLESGLLLGGQLALAGNIDMGYANSRMESQLIPDPRTPA